MNLLFIIDFFIIGLIFGSFFNVVGLRVPNGELFKHERSYCPYCFHTLRWFELIPILSFLIQRGRCRICNQYISKLYPTMEFLSGIAFAFCFYMYNWQWELLLALLLMSMFHIIVVSDFMFMIIPNRVLFFYFLVFLLYRFLDPLDPWWSSLVGVIIGFVGTAFIIIISRGGMGGGDMKLFGLLGLILGVKLFLVTFFLSTLIGAVVSGVLLGAGIISRKKPIPFGPFIVMGAMLAFFSGEMIIDWYLKTFF